MLSYRSRSDFKIVASSFIHREVLGRLISYLVGAAAGIEKGTITGTCTQMCPTSEIERRIRIEDIALFEREDPRVATTTSALAVKKFARNVSGFKIRLHSLPPPMHD